jgi:hypothetical protein
MNEMDSLADNGEKCQRQAEELAKLRHLMEAKQPAIERLSGFVAVVDQSSQQKREGEGGEAPAAETTLFQLETFVKEVRTARS